MRIAPAAVDLPEVINSLAPERLLTSHPAKLGADRFMCGALSFLVERPLGKQWTLALARHQNGVYATPWITTRCASECDRAGSSGGLSRAAR